jgi:hypothetical protein
VDYYPARMKTPQIIHLIVCLLLCSCAQESAPHTPASQPVQPKDSQEVAGGQRDAVNNRSVCWDIHTPVGNKVARANFQENFSVSAVLASANALRAAQPDTLADHPSYQTFDFVHWTGQIADTGAARFVARHDARGALRMIERLPGDGQRGFTMRLNPLGDKAAVAFLDMHCASGAREQDCNHHCGFFLFERGCSLRVFFGQRHVCARSAFHPNSLRVIYLCDAQLKPLCQLEVRDGKVHQVGYLAYDADCRLLPSPWHKESEFKGGHLDVAEMRVQELAWYLQARPASAGTIKQPENLNALSWKDCYPIFWGNDAASEFRPSQPPCQ